jgi:ABC-2 type transport system permease protein
MINALMDVCWGECLKLRRSRALLMSAAAYAMAPVTVALLMLAGNDPGRGSFYHLTTLDAQMVRMHADWQNYFSALAGASAIGGLILFSLFMIWIFGREHADRTSKELLTLPVPREALALGKILVAALWCLLLQCGMIAAAILLGSILELPGWSWGTLGAGLAKIFTVSGLAFLLAIPFGLVANLSRGTMAAVGVLFISLFFSLMMMALGWGAYFFWSIPALLSAASTVGGLSVCLVLLTGLAGILGHMAWWRFADQH